MAVVNVNLNNMLNMKDSRWLQLEVCREFQRSKCSRSDTECKFAHPPANVEVQNGRVIACYDSIKGRCNREKPPCKYFHPPQHLKDQLLINGRNHLALKNALMLQMGMSPGQHIIPGQLQTIASPYLTGVPQLSAAYSPYMSASPVLQMVSSDGGISSSLGVVSATGYPAGPTAKLQRSDRIEVCREFQRGVCRRAESDCRFAHPPEGVVVEVVGGDSTSRLGGASLGSAPSGAAIGSELVPTVTVCMDAVKGRCSRQPCRYFHPPNHLLVDIQSTQQRTTRKPNSTSLVAGYPGMVQYKRNAVDKSGMTAVYHHHQQSPGVSGAAAAAAYQQAHALMQLQQPFVPVSFTGHPPGMPRF